MHLLDIPSRPPPTSQAPLPPVILPTALGDHHDPHKLMLLLVPSQLRPESPVAPFTTSLGSPRLFLPSTSKTNTAPQTFPPLPGPPSWCPPTPQSALNLGFAFFSSLESRSQVLRVRTLEPSLDATTVASSPIRHSPLPPLYLLHPKSFS